MISIRSLVSFSMHKIKAGLYGLLFVIFIFLPATSWGQPAYVFNKLATQQGLSHSTTYAITQDDKGFIWIGTREGLNRYDGYEFKTYYVTERDTLGLDNNQILSLLYADSLLYIGTETGLNTYDYQQDVIRPVTVGHRPQETSDRLLSTRGNVSSVYRDRQGDIWIGTVAHYSQSYDGSPYALNDKAIYCIYRSREDIMWIGTYFGGVNYVKPEEKGFRTLKADGGNQALSGKAVSQLAEVNGELWIGTEDGGITRWDRQKNQFRYFRHSARENSIVYHEIEKIS